MPISIPSFGVELLFAAIKKGDLDEVKKVFRKSYINKFYQGMTPLRCACCMSNAQIVQFLLDQGCDIEDECNFKDRPIHTAVYFKQVSVLRELIKRGCKLNARNLEGQTPLDMAMHCNSEKCAEVILEAIKNPPTIYYNDPQSSIIEAPSTSLEDISSRDITKSTSKPGEDIPGSSSHLESSSEFVPQNIRSLKRLWLDSSPDPHKKKKPRSISDWRSKATPSKALIKERDTRRWGKIDNSLLMDLSPPPMSFVENVATSDLLDMLHQRYGKNSDLNTDDDDDDDDDDVEVMLPDMVSSICQICTNKQRDRVLNCGHAFCVSCCDQTTKCYVCHTTIKTRNKLYL